MKKIKIIVGVIVLIIFGFFGYSYYQLNTEVQNQNTFLETFISTDTTTGLNGFTLDVAQSEQQIQTYIQAHPQQ